MGSLAYLIQVLLCFNKQVLLCFMLLSQNDDNNTITQKFLNHYISVLDCGDFFFFWDKRYHHLENRRNIDGFNASKTCNGVVIVRPPRYAIYISFGSLCPSINPIPSASDPSDVI